MRQARRRRHSLRVCPSRLRFKQALPSAPVAPRRSAAISAPALATQYATIGANTQLAGGDVTTQATNLAVHEYAKTAAYFTEFPEDIHLIGASFNTQLQSTGIALQGEVAYRQNQPLQYDDVELLFSALGPFENGIATASWHAAAEHLSGRRGRHALSLQSARCVRPESGDSRLEPERHVAGTVHGDPHVCQRVSRGADGGGVRSAVTYIPGLENKFSGGPAERGLRYNGPGTSVSGNPELASRHFGEVEPADRFPDTTSWGYRLAGRLEYPNLIGPWNIIPRFSWSQDVNGTSPGPGGNFIEDRYGLTLGVAANLRATYEVDVSWTKFGGAGRYNDLNDRDFAAASVKIAF